MTTSLKLCLVILLAFGAWAGSQEGGEQELFDRVAPFNGYGHVYEDGSFESMRPRIMGTHGVISTGHYLSTLAGMEVLRKGGNAHDAGVAAAMALKVMKMGYAGWTGVAPLILYSAKEDRVITRVGAGTTPAKATLEYYLEHGKTDINMAIVPADVDVWLATLDPYGTLSFKEASRATIEIAEGGYHLYKHQKSLLDHLKEGILRFPYNVEFWYQQGVDKQQLGDLMVNKDLGKLVRYMVDAEAKVLASGGSRSEGIQAARDAFYKGEPARAVGDFYKQFEDGLVTYEDMSNYQGKWMDPLHTTYRGYDVYVCDGWSQGPRMLLFLNMLENFDIEALGYNTPAYIHLLSQIINLGMSDSYKYIGDPDVVDTPIALYSKAYARKRAELIDMEKAFQDMPPWGDPEQMLNISSDSPTSFARHGGVEASDTRVADMDTTSLNVMDREGNLFSMTESDGHMVSPMIPGWGFGIGRRGEQLNLDPVLANVMAPNKRPRNTNNPFLVLKDGKPFMGLSTPGGEQQAQAMLQVFLNVVVWGMAPEQAVDQPRFGSYNFPITGFEVNETPAQIKLEDRIPAETFETLKEMGHDVVAWGLWNWRACALTITYRDPASGLLIAAGDVRRETAALGF